MEGKMLVSQQKVDLANELAEELWQKILKMLSPEELKFLWAFDGIRTYLYYVDGTIALVGMKPEEALRCFEESMSEALDLFPKSEWPEGVYDVYPEREDPEVLEARIRELCDGVLTALAKIPEGRRRELLNAVAGWA